MRDRARIDVGLPMQSICSSIEQFRCLYASYLASVARQPTWPRGYAFQTRLEGAFEAVPRDLFLPPGPWHIDTGAGSYVKTPSADVRFLYQDVLVAIDKDRGINNGQPSGHAQFMGRLEPRPGETVVHIGAGTGYYSAILSMLVAPGGRVAAFELCRQLARRAHRNLSILGNVSVTAGDATALPLPQADVIYVNAGVVRPSPHWLRALGPQGRMFVPWRPAANIGIALFVRRSANGFSVDPAMPAWFIPCVGACSGSSTDRPPDASGAWSSRSLFLSSERAPDASATAIYGDVWFSSEPVQTKAAEHPAAA